MNEKEVISLLKDGNHEAFTSLYQQYWSTVYNFTRLYISSIDDAKEIVQQVFVKVWESRSFLKEEENFKGFLFIITRNIVFNFTKKSFNENYYKMSIINAFTENRIENSYEIEDKLFASELHQYITLLIETLPPRQKEIFLLSRNEELSYQEIADRLQISIKTVEHSISKSLKYLKKNIPLIYIFFVCC